MVIYYNINKKKGRFGLCERKNLFGNNVTHRINPNSSQGSDFFVFYPGKAVFGVVVKI